MGDLFQTLCEYLECSTWDEAERIVRDHLELLGPQTTMLLGRLRETTALQRSGAERRSGALPS